MTVPPITPDPPGSLGALVADLHDLGYRYVTFGTYPNVTSDGDTRFHVTTHRDATEAERGQDFTTHRPASKVMEEHWTVSLDEWSKVSLVDAAGMVLARAAAIAAGGGA